MPEHLGLSRRPRRAVIALCAVATTAMSGMILAPVSQADPNLTISEVKDKVDGLYHKAEQATEQYNAATDELADVQLRIERAKAAVTKQEAEVEKAKAGLAVFAAAAYRAGGMDPALRTFLADNPKDFLTQASVVEAYATQRSDQLAASADVRRSLEQARMVADEQLARQQAIEAKLKTEKASIEKLLAEAQGILDGLEAEERQRLEDERDRERERNADQPSRGDDDGEDAPDVPVSGRAGVAVKYALAQVGKPYCWGGTGPSCFDCSGLTSMAWAEAGVKLPRSSSSQISAGSRVSKSQLQPGDLVFYYSPISHVGIYIGGGKIVHATHPGDVVSVDSVDLMPFAGASRPG